MRHIDREARVRRTRITGRSLHNILEDAVIETGRCPESLDRLLDFYRQTGGNDAWILAAIDGWGHRFILAKKSANDHEICGIRSLGEDGLEGTLDDFELWSEIKETGG